MFNMPDRFFPMLRFNTPQMSITERYQGVNKPHTSIRPIKCLVLLDNVIATIFIVYPRAKCFIIDMRGNPHY